MVSRTTKPKLVLDKRSILQAHAADIAVATGVDTIVELGSGTSDKTRTLLDAFHERGTLRRFVLGPIGHAFGLDYAHSVVAVGRNSTA